MSDDRRSSRVRKLGSLPRDVITETSVVVITLHQWLLRNVEDDLHQSYLITYLLYRVKGMQADLGPVEWRHRRVSG